MIKQIKKLFLKNKENILPRKVFTIQFEDQDIQITVCFN